MSVTNLKNAWRRRVEGPKAWGERLRPGAKNKYFIVSCDAHACEEAGYWEDRVPPQYRDRLPRLETRADGTQWMISEGWRPQLINMPPNRKDLLPEREVFENWDTQMFYSERMEDEDIFRSSVGRNMESRLQDLDVEGVDAQIIFPGKGLIAFASPDPDFVAEMCMAWNRWALDTFKDHSDKLFPVPMIPVGNVEKAIKEVHWAARNGFRGLLIPNRPMFNRLDQPRAKPEYNDKCLEPLWDAIEEVGLPMVLHVSTSGDPRSVGGAGSATTNYVLGEITPMEPILQLITSGVFERHPKLKLAVVEAGIGWVPWMLYQMDLGAQAHHMWTRPVLPKLPSEYFKDQIFVTFVEEERILNMLVEMGYENNLLWANDYPHPEGSFPHSIITIERSMGNLNDSQRAKVLGLNACKLFNINPG